MVNKKINKNIRKSSGLGDIAFPILIVLFLFTASFLYWTSSLEATGGSMNAEYNSTYSNLAESQADLKETFDEMETKGKALSEADSTWGVAWNGIKGLGTLLILPFNLLDTGASAWSALKINLPSSIPSELIVIAGMALAIGILLIVISVLRGKN